MTKQAAPSRAGVDAARTWYRIENKADTAEVFLYDEIGAWGISAGDFAKELGEVTAKSIDLRLNTPGGEVFDGLAIFNALQRHPARVTVHIDGLAASIASVIAMAGDEILIDRYAQMMIHEAHAIAVGSTKDMSAMAKLLDEYSDNIAAIYSSRAGGDKTGWRERMKAETWFSASEAVKAGLADRIAETTVKGKPAATWDLSMFNHAGRAHAPDPFPAEPPPAPPPDSSPAPESPPDEAGFFVPDIRDVIAALDEIPWNAEVFRAAISLVANDSPAAEPPAPAVKETPEPEFSINVPDLRRTLTEATL